MADPLTIGEVAQRAGVNASAIRYYEANGVLPEPARVSGQRRYGEDAVRRLALLGVAKRAGFSLDEAAELLGAVERGQSADLRSLAERKLPQIEAELARAREREAWLQLASVCECQTLDECGLFR
jgi:MerR family redox-sensitive transcriptional activator SoxR